MGKTKFVFDANTGTLEPEKESVAKTSASSAMPKMGSEAVSLDLNAHRPDTNPDEPIIGFRQNTDYTIFQVTEERSRKTLMVIGGYGLEIKFNVAELRSTERIEQLLGGLNTLFRKLILEQVLSKGQ